VVGSYDEVLSAAAQPPTPIYSFFLNSLLETVRLTIGECLGSAYQNISVPAAIKMLKFETKSDIEEFINDNYPTWRIEGNKIYFESEVKAGKSTEIPSIKLIEQTLSYATELERIV
jgi:26S proteasome regulatory subunit N12